MQNNKVLLKGFIGQNPDFLTTSNGLKRLKFSIATNDTYTTKQGAKATDTQWHSCICWGKLAEDLNTTLKKGSKVQLSGKLTHRNYEDKNGIKRYITEILIQECEVVPIEKPVAEPQDW